MTTIEKFETSIILILGFFLLLITKIFPAEIGIGQFLLYTSALLLLQSLIRDLCILYENRNMDKLKTQRVARCMCVESTIGAVGILIAVMLLGIGLDLIITMNGWSWVIVIEAILILGYYIKDFVFEWMPWRFYKDNDHINIVFTWKSKSIQDYNNK